MFCNRKFSWFTIMTALVVCASLGCDVTLPPLDGPDGGGDDATDVGSNGGGSADNASDSAGASNAKALFDEVWQTFDENYSYFTYKGIDWDDVGERHRPNFDGQLSDAEFVDRLVEMLAELSDFHVEVMRPDGTWLGTDTQEVELNYTSTPRNRYTADDAGYRTLGDGVVWHAWLPDSIAYIRVDTFGSEAFADISNQEIEGLFVTYANAAGMILDVRPNNGGNENNATRFASHFTAQEVLYGFTEIRDGPDHDDFRELDEKWLIPSGENRFDGPVVCLIGQRCLSSAEWFTLMMRACPNVTLVGDTTRGGSGFPREFELDNGVRYTVPRWVAYTDEFEGIEDVGIDPDFQIPATESFDESHDYVVEFALTLFAPDDPDPDDSFPDDSFPDDSFPDAPFPDDLFPDDLFW